MQKIQKIVKFLFLISVFIGIIILFEILIEIPTIADWGDYDYYDSSSSYDDWGSSSSSSDWDWGSSSSSSDWGSSWDDYDDDHYYGRRSSLPIIITNNSGILIFIFIAFIIIFFFLMYKNYKDNNYSVGNGIKRKFDFDAEVMRKRTQNRETLFGVSDKQIEDSIQADDPLFNKAEFLTWAGDMFVKLQYAWSDRNLETIRYFITPELYEQTNTQVQRYITNKQINKLERVSVNLSRLYSYDKQGDRDILRIVLESKMNDYIIDENTGLVVKGNKDEEHVNPYILTFVRKSGIKTEGGEIKPVTMNCPNCRWCYNNFIFRKMPILPEV